MKLLLGIGLTAMLLIGIIILKRSHSPSGTAQK